MKVALGAAGLSPLAALLVWSFARRWYYPDVLPGEWATSAWARLLDPATRVAAAAASSVLVAGGAALLGVLIALPAARVLAKSTFRGRTILLGVLLAPLLLPSFAGVFGVHVVFVRLGLTDTLVGVIAAHLVPVVPYAVVLLTGTWREYDERLEEGARMLGATRWHALVLVTLPALRPGLLVALLFAFLVSWSEYLLTLLIGGASVLTLPVVLLASASGGDTALTAALAVVYTVPPLAAYALTAKNVRSWRA
ncbi:ABC transporter permease [Deinococcus yavapaiensis]|uniref:Putative spermidine/putrescine transport system permease protein n=1 Tax=Deinococcus yavapaiensis KR-236 TaxID=694435 RepID=A0A318S4V1_9DEIO|nr:ABC transporter permease subunit [Deinococcus yavapaiensis]PYE53107.1 putative spermidine/putrescine transport system permease protein [Deinococcus yavapaiensis KR-236]